jgi:hemolysin activation/secretion protein
MIRLLLPILLLANLAIADSATPAPPPTRMLSSGEPVTISKFSFEGNTVFDHEQLAEIPSSFLDRPIAVEDIETLRLAISRAYVEAGYINSGAAIDDQDCGSGVLTVRIVEGALTEVKVDGLSRLRPRFIASRLHHAAGTPLNLATLQNGLRLLKQDPNIRRVNAELKPGLSPGESYLALTAAEAEPWRLSLSASNRRPASVGAEILELNAAHMSLTGNGDPISLNYGLSDGAFDRLTVEPLNVSFAYTYPITGADTRLTLGASRGDQAILEEPFSNLDIESRIESYSLGIRHPLLRTPQRELALSLTGEHTRSETFLLGKGFSLSPGANDGVTRVTALRLAAEYSDRSAAQAFAARSTFSQGIDLFNSSDSRTDDQNGRFTSFRLQGNWRRALNDRGRQLAVRMSSQWTSEPLLSLEQFSVGGVNTVRGYRPNQVVRGRGTTASLELHWPLLFAKGQRPILTLVPFLDYGVAQSASSGGTNSIDIGSAGFGLIAQPHPRLNCQLFWGQAFRNFETNEHDLQDDGIHFLVTFTAF